MVDAAQALLASYSHIQEPVAACTGNGRSVHRNKAGATDAAKNEDTEEEYVAVVRNRKEEDLGTSSKECIPTGLLALVEEGSTVQTKEVVETA